MREIIELKRRVGPLLADARFRDDVGLTATGAEATVFVGDGLAFIVFARTEDGPATVTLDLDALGVAPPRAAQAWLTGASDAPRELTGVAVRNAVLTLSLPAASAGVIELH